MKIIPDKVHKNMYRIEFQDGTFSDMYNITWAKEHLRRLKEQEIKGRT